jgi:outer membrane protein assembly factor BamA
LGGVGSVRGYFPRSIASERRTADGNLLVGGTSRLQQSIELDVPMWPQSPIRLFGFFDAGNAFDDRGASDVVGPLLFTSVGGGVCIDNGALPLRFEWSFPLNRRGIDQPVNFFIGVGSSI